MHHYTSKHIDVARNALIANMSKFGWCRFADAKTHGKKLTFYANHDVRSLSIYGFILRTKFDLQNNTLEIIDYNAYTALFSHLAQILEDLIYNTYSDQLENSSTVINIFNDRICKSKETVVALFTEALKCLKPSD
jgi:hypothetical protein